MAGSPSMVRVKSWLVIPALVSHSYYVLESRRCLHEDLALFLAPNAVPALAVLDQLHLHHGGVPHGDGAGIRRTRVLQPPVRARPHRPGAVVVDRAVTPSCGRPHRLYLRPGADQCALYAH